MSLEEITPKPTLPPKPVAIKTTINMAITGDPSWMNAGEEKSSITTSRSIIAMPDNYDGKPENFTTFWALAKAFMSLNEKQFPTAQHKVLFILSRCKGGKAGPWATAQILDKTRTNDWGTWDDFETQFKQSFYPALTKKEAYMKLAHLKMTEHMRLTDFEALWDTYTTQAEITPDITHWHHFLSKLPRKINMELLRLEREPKDYEGWRKAARKADSIVHQDHYEVNNFSEWWTDDKPKEEPYQLNAVSDAERQRRFRQNLCFNCGKAGHLAKDCRSNNSNRYDMEKEEIETSNQTTNQIDNSGPLEQEGNHLVLRHEEFRP